MGWGLGDQRMQGAVCPGTGGQGGADPLVAGLGVEPRRGQGWGHVAVRWGAGGVWQRPGLSTGRG